MEDLEKNVWAIQDDLYDAYKNLQYVAEKLGIELEWM